MHVLTHELPDLCKFFLMNDVVMREGVCFLDPKSYDVIRMRVGFEPLTSARGVSYATILMGTCSNNSVGMLFVYCARIISPHRVVRHQYHEGARGAYHHSDAMGP